MTGRFRAIFHPDQALLEALCGTDPANPFQTPEFVTARSAIDGSAEPWALVMGDGDTIDQGCVGYLQRSRLPWSHRFEIHSLCELAGADVDEFWAGVWSLCRREGVSRLTVQTFGSRPAVVMPVHSEHLWRRDRCEYLLSLDGFPGRQALSSNHRRNVNRAERASITFAESNDSASCAVHASLMGLSMQRRRLRGESVGRGDGGGPARRLLASGAASLFQAVQNDTVMSSILVLRARSGAYYHSAGTSPEGMKAGASHLLVLRLAEHLRNQGLAVFNLGGADGDGLARFKSGFGAEPIALKSAAYDTGHIVARGFNVMISGLRRRRS